MPRVMVYKQTHLDDPGETGVLGVLDCLKEHRGRDFDAVIALLGDNVSWAGVGAEKIMWHEHAPQVIFKHFLPFLPGRVYPAPVLTELMAGRPRVPLIMPIVYTIEVQIILRLVVEAPPSPGGRPKGGC